MSTFLISHFGTNFVGLSAFLLQSAGCAATVLMIRRGRGLATLLMENTHTGEALAAVLGDEPATICRGLTRPGLSREPANLCLCSACH